MGRTREMLVRIAVALGASALLAVVLVRQHGFEVRRSPFLTTGNPRTGAHLFHAKGCTGCHSVAAMTKAPLGLSQLVAALWNHAPNMSDRLAARGMSYPRLTTEEIAHIFAFLYFSQFEGEPGDAAAGRRLFMIKGCSQCHSSGLKNSKTAMAWIEAMWNHAPQVDSVRFDGREMEDLLAFLGGGEADPSTELLAANPERGWELFRTKGCIACHSINGEGGSTGPELGPGRALPLTAAQFAGAMWNHMAAMSRPPATRAVFRNNEMADIISFLSGLRYVEPRGSPYMGKTVFTDRGCAGCHGQDAGKLRQRGTPFTAITLAAAFWQHGTRMYRQAAREGRPWPALSDADIGQLVAYLNGPPSQK